MSIKILIVAATDLEIKPLLRNKDFDILNEENLKRVILENIKTDILISTIGIAATTYHLTKVLSSSNYDFVINAGICGAFGSSLNLGDVVSVDEDNFAELAVETEDGLKPIKLVNSLDDKMLTTKIINLNQILSPQISSLRKVKGVTVSTITSSRKRIENFRKMYAPDVESMEGAAFLYVCNAFCQPCAQIRSISNHIGNPNRNDWNIELAVNNLAKVILRIIDELELEKSN